MKKTVEKMELITVIAGLLPRESVDRKLYPEYSKGIKELLKTVYSVYQAREKGTSNTKLESEAMSKVTEFLHTLGKANGKYISVAEKVADKNGKEAILFDMLVYNSFRYKIFTTDKTLASLLCEKSIAGKKKAEAHKKLIEGKGTAKDYKEAVASYESIVAKIEAERKKAGTEAEQTVSESNGTFERFVTSTLKAIIKNRFALTPEEAEAQRKLGNKSRKATRKGKPKAESKKPETKAE